MKTSVISRILSLLLVLCLIGSLAIPGFAIDPPEIDTSKTGSIQITKYDMTTAEENSEFERESFVTTGAYDEEVEKMLAPFAVPGVVFSYTKVADVSTGTVETDEGILVVMLYAFEEGDATTQLLNILGLTVEDAYSQENGVINFVSDTLVKALAAKVKANSSAAKDALRAYMEAQGAEDMPVTSETGKTSVSGLELGLYLVLESSVPKDVSKTIAPFFISVPMTNVDGTECIYDVVLYPKNETDGVTLDKTLRESAPDTGKHNGTTDDILDGYAPYATGSAGDVVDYQIISTLPAITSDVTSLTTYTFVDTLSKGIEYNKGDVKLEWYKDTACTELITTWTEADEKFTVTYGTAENDATTMTIAMTETGLAEINTADTVYGADSEFSGYSDCTVRITYACTVNSNADVVYGDKGNPNEVTLTWTRTNTEFVGELKDDCHFYVYGLKLTKKFENNPGNMGEFKNVNFAIWNETDSYWVIAEKDEKTGIYYVTGHSDMAEITDIEFVEGDEKGNEKKLEKALKEAKDEAKEDATIFVPDKDGVIIVKGLEDDAYSIVETKTHPGYGLPLYGVEVVITASETNEICDICGAKSLTASATVEGKAVAMTEDNSSVNAVVPLTIMNYVYHGPEVPGTSDASRMGLIICGTMAIISALCIIVLVCVKSRRKEQ